jgi:hypothetical protein
MTRPSERELRRTIENLSCRFEPNTDATLFIAPDAAFDDDDIPDVSTDGIRALDDKTGRREIIVPHHRPDHWWADRIPVVAESHVAAVWQAMTAQQRARERQIREQYDHPIPPVLTEVDT